MGSKWKSLEKNKHNELVKLQRIIKKTIGIDIQDKSRYQDVVDARIIFSALARQIGCTFKQISFFLNKNHATVIHYLKNFDQLIVSLPSFKEKYDEIKSCFLEDKEPSVLMKESFSHKVNITDLKNQIERLILQKQQLMAFYNKNKRVEKIIDLINTKTPIGLEDFVRNKIIQMFNSSTFFEI
jgi:hypothetical protein